MNPSFLEDFKHKLKKRNAPKTKKEFFFGITEEEKEKEEKEEDESIEKQSKKKKIEEDESETEIREEPKKKHEIQIIDKSKTAVIDRDLILKRIRESKHLPKTGNLIISRELHDRGISEGLQTQVDIKEDVVKTQMMPTISEKSEIEKSLVLEQKEIEKEPEQEKEKEPPQKIKIKPGKKRITIKATPSVIPPPATQLLEEESKPILEKHDKDEKPQKIQIKKPRIKIVSKIPIKEALIDDKRVSDRLPPHEKIIQRVSNYYMNNRKIAIEKLTKLFEPERREFQEKKETVSCDSKSGPSFDLLPHQKIAREYLNLYTPYRGLLLYFSLGSGKSCTSIAIAEGMKSDKRIFIMTPASLKMNFFTELKKCGDPLFKKNQYWEFVSTVGHPNYVDILSSSLSVSRESIEKKHGAWLVDIRKPSNFSELSGTQQKEIDDQLNEMIRSKYTDLNYNGMNMRKLRELTDDFSKNPFDHSVVIIDEAHNFVSRIVNKIKKPNSISYKLYDLLMKATDVRIVMLSGTPIINYPNEIGILYNILRGYIKTWVFHLNVKTSQKINKETILEIFDKERFRTFDYVEYSGNKLTITRNPYGFINMKKPGRDAKHGGKKSYTKKTKTFFNNRTRAMRASDYRVGETAASQLPRLANKTKKQTPIIINFDEKSILDSDEKMDDFEKENSSELMEEIDQSNQGNRVPGLDYDKISSVHGGDAFEKYNGVKLDSTGNISDQDFVKTVIKVLSKNGIDVMEGATETILNKSLPDDSESFLNIFIDQDQAALKNKRLLQRRILGLTSYYRSAQEQLLPNFVETIPDDPKEQPSVFHIEETEMSDYQFKSYSEIRKVEREQERKSKKQAKRKKPSEEDIYKISSTYRIFSRACCNFVFPTPPGRPMPSQKVDEVLNEANFDATPANLIQTVDDYADNEDEEDKAASPEGEPIEYSEKIAAALNYLKEHSDEFLTPRGLETYSPKFKRILENLQNPENRGLHLIYSQFRTIEGIGILQIILEANGFERLMVNKNETSGEWILQEPKDPKKPRFLLYTGTETPEEREILRNIYNSQWEFLPPSMADQLRAIADNNHMGEIVKIMMITASGAEGINLKNTRFVHIVEPYWHMVRLEQVIGRARRICSHQDLPEELRTVKVFLYISSFTKEQSTSDTNKELIINDVSKLDKKTPLTTDQTLYETARIKDTINQQILISIKESAIDCGIYGSSKENLVCYGFGKIKSNDFGSFPSLMEDEQQKDDLNIKREKLRLIKATINGIEYAYDKTSSIVYDLESYERSKRTGENLIVVGKVSKIGKKFVIEPVLS